MKRWWQTTTLSTRSGFYGARIGLVLLVVVWAVIGLGASSLPPDDPAAATVEPVDSSLVTTGFADTVSVATVDSLRGAGGAVDSTVAPADSVLAAAAANDSLPVTPALPDTLWALQLPSLATLDSARAWYEGLSEFGLDGFVRIRADRHGYWYEPFVGPAVDTVAVDTLRSRVQEVALAETVAIRQATGDELFLGAVLAPASVAARAPRPELTVVTVQAAVSDSAGAAEALPKIIELVEPAYPEAARRSGHLGTVVVRVLIGTAGELRDIEIIQSVHHSLDAAALEAAAKCRFAPALVDGEPVAAWLEIPYEFKGY
jgi:TonB family protein